MKTSSTELGISEKATEELQDVPKHYCTSNGEE